MLEFLFRILGHIGINFNFHFFFHFLFREKKKINYLQGRINYRIQPVKAFHNKENGFTKKVIYSNWALKLKICSGRKIEKGAI